MGSDGQRAGLAARGGGGGDGDGLWAGQGSGGVVEWPFSGALVVVMAREQRFLGGIVLQWDPVAGEACAGWMGCGSGAMGVGEQLLLASVGRFDSGKVVNGSAAR